MSWKDQIPGAFGSVDMKFARHSDDSKRAATLLLNAIEEEVGFSEYLAGLEDWLRNQNCPEQHISDELAHAKQIASYFTSD